MRHTACLGLLVAAFALPSVLAMPKDKVKLVRKTKKGDRLAVKESSHTETTYHWKGEGEGSAGGQEVEDVQRDFLQEVLKENPLVLKREYKLSTRAKGKPKDTAVEPVRTSIHGKTVVIGPEGPHIESGGDLSKEDREQLNTVEKIAYACLPKDEVAQGDSWKIGDEIGKALFGEALGVDGVKSAGSGKLDSFKMIDGRRAAKLTLKCAIEVKPTEIIPSITLELKGQAWFLVEEGVFTELVLEGPLKILIEKNENGHKKVMSGEGVTTYKLKGEVVAGAPEPPAPKPLAKDDELARSERLQCAKDEKHNFPNRFQFCAQCGKEIDKETQRCVGGKCPPLLRFCPLCGEGLKPAPAK
ncbi:MAG: hypothetical protein ACAI25_06775 [Planctomycetota bacterium]